MMSLCPHSWKMVLLSALIDGFSQHTEDPPPFPGFLFSVKQQLPVQPSFLIDSMSLLSSCFWFLLFEFYICIVLSMCLVVDFIYLFFPFIFISWRLITLQYCSGFWHTLTWISHGFTRIPHPDPHSHLPLHPIPLGLPSAPGPSTCLMHHTWAGDLFHPW